LSNSDNELHLSRVTNRPTRRPLLAVIQYDGGGFAGWQRQPPPARTVQAEFESVLERLLGKRVAVTGAGRTDAGVHALGQVASVTVGFTHPVETVTRAMNAQLPEDIRVLEVVEAPADFHARFSAVGKTYEYRVLRSAICLPFERHYVHHHPYPLDEERMGALAPLLEGEHDFSAFAASDETDELRRSKVRTIFSSCLHRNGERLIYRVRGSGFLKHMVRNIVGTLVEIGRGRQRAEWVDEVLASGDRTQAGRTAPAEGLFLVSVDYGAQL